MFVDLISVQVLGSFISTGVLVWACTLFMGVHYEFWAVYSRSVFWRMTVNLQCRHSPAQTYQLYGETVHMSSGQIKHVVDG